MKARRIPFIFLGIALLSVGSCSYHQRVFFPGSICLDQDGKEFYVGDALSPRLAQLDIDRGGIRRLIPLAFPVTCMTDLQDGRLLLAGDDGGGKLAVLEKRTWRADTLIEIGHTLSAVVIDSVKRQVYLADRFQNCIHVLDMRDWSRVDSLPCHREPVALAFCHPTACLLAANLLPADASTADTVSAVIDVFDVRTRRPVASIRLPDGSTGVRDICASSDGFAYVTHTLGFRHMPTNRIDRGWATINALSVLDLRTLKCVATFPLDEAGRGAANPWGIALSEDESTLGIAHAGTDELSLVDRQKLHAKLSAQGQEGPLFPDLSFLAGGIRTRVPIVCKGPRQVCFGGGRFCAVCRFGAGVVLSDPDGTGINRIRLGKGRMTPAQEGEMYFNDALICFQHWQSCATCHPDGRMDGLNWDQANDGWGNPKNTKSLLLAHQTPPSMVTGIRRDAETAVRAGIRHILFEEPGQEVAEDMDIYLKSMSPAASPRSEDGAVRRGRELFFGKKAGCADCHPSPLYTDMKLHDVGTSTPVDSSTTRDGHRVAQSSFDTPSLVEVWRTAPYLHDGRFVDLKETLSFLLGRTGRTLDEEELEDLMAFVRSL